MKSPSEEFLEYLGKCASQDVVPILHIHENGYVWEIEVESISVGPTTYEQSPGIEISELDYQSISLM